MPILTGTPPIVRVPPTPQPIRDRTANLWEWQSAQGERLMLTGSTDGPVYLPPGGVTGHMLPPLALADDDTPAMDGGMFRSAKWQPRILGVRLEVAADDQRGWRAAYRGLVRLFKQGEGRLLCHSIDGDVLYARCRYRSGLEAPTGGDPGARFYGEFVLQLVAHDPWWYAPEQVMTFTVRDPVPAFPRQFPYTLPEAVAAGVATTVPNPGDESAYPRWTVTGPCSAVTITGDGSRSLTLTHTLSAGKTLTVTTDPRVSGLAKIVDGAGTNLWGVATGDFPDLFPLPDGESQVVVDVTDPGDGTRVELSWEPRWSTA